MTDEPRSTPGSSPGDSPARECVVIDLTRFHRVAGVCDLLRALTFGAALATARGVTVLSIHQASTPGCADTLVDLIAMRGFKLKRWEPDDGPAEFIMNSYTSFPSIKTVTEKLPRLELRGIGGDAFLSGWKAMYKHLKPHRDFASAVDALEVNDSCVGVHIRATDKASKKPSRVEVQARRFPEVIRRTERAVFAQLSALQLDKVYVASDNAEALGFWKRTLDRRGIRMLHNPGAQFDVSRMRQTSGGDFLVDLFALSRCKALVGSVNSGVPVTASLIGGKPTSAILWGRYYLGGCSLRTNTLLRDLRRAWLRGAVLKGKDFCPSMAFLSV